MPLLFEKPPPDCLSALQQGLHQVHQSHRMLSAGGRPKTTIVDAPSVMRPHPVYNLGVDALAMGKGIDAAKLASWRYLLIEGEVIEKAAEVGVSSAGPTKFHSINAGPAVAGTVEALAVAERLPQVQKQSYDIRLLRIPELSVQALWLHGQGHEDLFLLMQVLNQLDDRGTIVGRLEAQKPYSAAQVIPALAAQAKRRMRLARDLEER